MRDWSFPNHDSDDYKDYQQRKQAIEQKYKAALEQEFPPSSKSKRTGTKYMELIEAQKTSTRQARKELEKTVHALVNTYWQQHRTNGPGPWHKNLDETMFWM